eukprot:TRINITY_DN5254_c0_g2_i1.p1 TRINITY_DN5254_c0_g2~~TRINITY_DN5254_c0_g2_i1.p1  ORF type:complete len:344 (+),score=66.81 TRINITY_DN5254_c0_g2_i1:48-1034(+)
MSDKKKEKKEKREEDLYPPARKQQSKRRGLSQLGKSKTKIVKKKFNTMDISLESTRSDLNMIQRSKKGKLKKRGTSIQKKKKKSTMERSKSAFGTTRKESPLSPSLALLLPQTTAKFGKRIEDLPLHNDLPRLLAKIRVLDEDSHVIWEALEDRESMPDGDNLIELLACFGNKLGLDVHELRNTFDEYMREDEDYNTCLKEFFINGLGPNNGIIGILKCLNQDIIVPAVTVLRFSFFTAQLIYFEIRGKWEISVQFHEENVTITHTRWERSQPECYCFSWRVSFEMNRPCTKVLDTSLCVPEVIFQDDPPPQETKEKLMEAISDLLIT